MKSDSGTTVLYFSPHQDDELLTMGLDFLRNTSRGADVHVILCSDGSKSGVRQILSNGKTCGTHPGRHEFVLTKEEFTASRDLEFIGSCLALGVKRDHIHIPENRMTDGMLSAEECREWIKRYTVLYGEGSRICTLLPCDHNGQLRDHFVLGAAAKMLFDEGFLTRIRLFSEPYLDKPQNDVSLKTEKAGFFERIRLKKAAGAYSLWKPSENRYAIGLHSVKKAFRGMTSEAVFSYTSFEH